MPEKQTPLYDGFTKITGEGNSAKVTIRKPFMAALGLRLGDTVQVRLVDGALVIRSVQSMLDEINREFAPRDRAAVAAADPLAHPS